MAEATAYARVMLFAMPGFFAFMLITSIMRGVGDTVTPLYALIVSTIVGLIVTPVLIRGWFGLPHTRRHQRRHRRRHLVRDHAGLARRSTCAARAMRWRRARSSRSTCASTAPSSSPCCASAFPPRMQMVIMSLAEVALLTHGQWLRLACHRGLWRGQPGAGLRAVPGDVHRHRGIHPGRAGHRRRPHREARARSRAPAS